MTQAAQINLDIINKAPGRIKDLTADLRILKEQQEQFIIAGKAGAEQQVKSLNELIGTLERAQGIYQDFNDTVNNTDKGQDKSKLKDELLALEKTIKELQETQNAFIIAGLAGTEREIDNFNRLTAAIAESNAKFRELNDTTTQTTKDFSLEEVISELERLKATIDEESVALEEFKKELGPESVQGLDAAVNKLKQDFSNITGSIGGTTEASRKLTTQIDLLKTARANAERPEDVIILSRNIQNLESQLTRLNNVTKTLAPNFNNPFRVTSSSVSELKDKLKDLQNALENATQTDDVEQLTKEFSNTKKELDDLEKTIAAKGRGSGIAGFGDIFKSGTKNVGDFAGALNLPIPGLDKLAGAFTSPIGAVLALTAAIAAGIGALAVAARDTAQYAKEQANLQKSTASSASFVAALTAGIKSLGGDSRDVSDVLLQLGDVLQQASRGGLEAQQRFEVLGVKYKDAAGRIRSVEEVYRDIDRIAKQATLSQEQLVSIAGIVGEDGAKKILPFVGSLDKLEQKVKSAGLVLQEDAAKSSAKFSESLIDVGLKLEGVRNIIGGAVIPAFNILLEAVKDTLETLANDEDFVAGIKQFGIVLKDVFSTQGVAAIKTIGGLVEVIGKLGFVIRAVQDPASGIIELLKGFGIEGGTVEKVVKDIQAALNAVLNPLGSLVKLYGIISGDTEKYTKAVEANTDAINSNSKADATQVGGKVRLKLAIEEINRAITEQTALQKEQAEFTNVLLQQREQAYTQYLAREVASTSKALLDQITATKEGTKTILSFVLGSNDLAVANQKSTQKIILDAIKERIDKSVGLEREGFQIVEDLESSNVTKRVQAQKDLLTSAAELRNLTLEQRKLELEVAEDIFKKRKQQTANAIQAANDEFNAFYIKLQERIQLTQEQITKNKQQKEAEIQDEKQAAAAIAIINKGLNEELDGLNAELTKKRTDNLKAVIAANEAAAKSQLDLQNAILASVRARIDNELEAERDKAITLTSIIDEEEKKHVSSHEESVRKRSALTVEQIQTEIKGLKEIVENEKLNAKQREDARKQLALKERELLQESLKFNKEIEEAKTRDLEEQLATREALLSKQNAEEKIRINKLKEDVKAGRREEIDVIRQVALIEANSIDNAISLLQQKIATRKSEFASQAEIIKLETELINLEEKRRQTIVQADFDIQDAYKKQAEALEKISEATKGATGSASQYFAALNKLTQGVSAIAAGSGAQLFSNLTEQAVSQTANIASALDAAINAARAKVIEDNARRIAAEKEAQEQIIEVINNAQDQQIAAQKKHDQDLENLEKDHAKKIGDINKAIFAAKLEALFNEGAENTRFQKAKDELDQEYSDKKTARAKEDADKIRDINLAAQEKLRQDNENAIRKNFQSERDFILDIAKIKTDQANRDAELQAQLAKAQEEFNNAKDDKERNSARDRIDDIKKQQKANKEAGAEQIRLRQEDEDRRKQIEGDRQKALDALNKEFEDRFKDAKTPEELQALQDELSLRKKNLNQRFDDEQRNQQDIAELKRQGRLDEAKALQKFFDQEQEALKQNEAKEIEAIKADLAFKLNLRQLAAQQEQQEYIDKQKELDDQHQANLNRIKTEGEDKIAKLKEQFDLEKQAYKDQRKAIEDALIASNLKIKTDLQNSFNEIDKKLNESLGVATNFGKGTEDAFKKAVAGASSFVGILSGLSDAFKQVFSVITNQGGSNQSSSNSPFSRAGLSTNNVSASNQSSTGTSNTTTSTSTPNSTPSNGQPISGTIVVAGLQAGLESIINVEKEILALLRSGSNGSGSGSNTGSGTGGSTGSGKPQAVSPLPPILAPKAPQSTVNPVTTGPVISGGPITTGEDDDDEDDDSKSVEDIMVRIFRRTQKGIINSGRAFERISNLRAKGRITKKQAFDLGNLFITSINSKLSPDEFRNRVQRLLKRTDIATGELITDILPDSNRTIQSPNQSSKGKIAGSNINGSINGSNNGATVNDEPTAGFTSGNFGNNNLTNQSNNQSSTQTIIISPTINNNSTIPPGVGAVDKRVMDKISEELKKKQEKDTNATMQRLLGGLVISPR